MTVNVNGYGDTAEYLGPAEVPGEATPTRSVVLVYHPVAIAECCCAGLAYAHEHGFTSVAVSD